MICLKNLARNHSIAIVTSIHQPNIDVLMLFDQLYVLATGGQCVYNGHPSVLKQHLVECHIPLMDYQIPIEELIKVASHNSNYDLVNKLVNKTFDSSCKEELWTNQGKIIKGSFTQKSKAFSFNDLLILLRRTIKNEIIGGWKIQLGFIISILLGVLLMLYLFPNDIGADPGCPQEVIDLRNISSINQRILDVIMGNEQKFQQNIKLIHISMLIIYFLNVIQLSYSCANENQVKIA